MRSLTVVKDELGNVKIAQFGNVVEEEGFTEQSSVERVSTFFQTFVLDSSNISKLQRHIEQISFFQPSELNRFYFDLIRQSKASNLKYYNNFLDVEIGVEILGKCSEFNSKTRLVSYYAYAKDIMFAPLYFEINYATGQALIRYHGSTIFQHKIGEPNTNAKGEPVKSRGRKKQPEEEKLHRQLRQAQQRTNKKRK